MSKSFWCGTYIYCPIPLCLIAQYRYNWSPFIILFSAWDVISTVEIVWAVRETCFRHSTFNKILQAYVSVVCIVSIYNKLWYNERKNIKYYNGVWTPAWPLQVSFGKLSSILSFNVRIFLYATFCCRSFIHFTLSLSSVGLGWAAHIPTVI